MLHLSEKLSCGFFVAGLLFGQTQTDYISQIKNKPAVDSREYVFTRTNGAGASGDLTVAGSGKTITLTPCPRGIDATSANFSSVYISGGIGTAEAVPITAYSGNVSSCVITVTTSGIHSGSWVVQSVAVGIQEAAIANRGKKIVIPCGDLIIRSTIKLDSPVEIEGCGADDFAARGTVLINYGSTSVPTISVIQGGGTNYNTYLHDFSIKCSSARTCGSGIEVTTAVGTRLERITVQESGRNGISLAGCVACRLTDVKALHSGRDGILVSAASNNTVLDHCVATDSSWDNGYANIQVDASLAVVLQNVDSESCGGNPSAHPGVTSCYNFLFSGASSGIRLVNSYSEVAIPSGSLLMYIASTVKNTTLSGNYFQDGQITSDGDSLEIGSNYWWTSGAATTGFNAASNANTVIYTGRQTLGAGGITLSPAPAGTVSASSGAATLNAQQGVITSESLTTAAGDLYTLTLTNNMINASSVVHVSTALASATQGLAQVVSTKSGSGSVVIVIKNIHATQAFNGTIQVTFSVNNIG